MANRVGNDEELKAWDVYFAAALSEARKHANGGSNEAINAEWLKIAAEFADKMIVLRRLREPK